jgi:hypothetical protein
MPEIDTDSFVVHVQLRDGREGDRNQKITPLVIEVVVRRVSE